MGDPFSTRWNGIRTRQVTSGVLGLDMTTLRRIGALAPGTLAWLEWSNELGERVGSIRTLTSPACDTLTLIYRSREHGGEWHDVRERVALEATSCHFGGSRFWFLCPACSGRRRILYSVGGLFRCRACHDLAYKSTREDARARTARRIASLLRRLGASASSPFAIPARPKGMRGSTYARIVEQLLDEQKRHAAFYDRLTGVDSEKAQVEQS